MNSIQRFGNRLNTRYLILGLVIWWLAMLIAYSIFTLRVNHFKGKLRQSGVKIVNEFSSQVSLPLLEKNSLSISKLLTDAANRTDVIYASVVDHRNKVVAFTGTETSLTPVLKLEKFSSASLPPKRFRSENILYLLLSQAV